MRTLQTDVLVIGGGATGLGVARDAAMRGYEVVVVERRDLGEGTTGRFHGLLHSGARYAVKDPRSARECMEENVILRRIAADCIEDSGGLFVSLPEDDPGYAERFVGGCEDSDIPVAEVPVAEALKLEPRLNPAITRAFSVPDGGIDAWKLLWSSARSLQDYGGKVLTYTPVVDLVREDDRVAGAKVRDELKGEEFVVRSDFTVNASGAWAGQIADMAGCRELVVLPGKGIMIAMNHRLVNTVINRLTMPSDGDILVPIRTVSVIGTTDLRVADPDELPVTQAEVDQMLADGERLVPGFRGGRALRVWAGVRPLYQPGTDDAGTTRDISRSHTLIDHRERDGISGFLTITGGKATTFRRMAEDTVDAMCEQLGVERRCRTHEEALPDSEEGRYYWMGSRLSQREESLHDEQLICECELITRSKLVEAIERRSTTNLDDVRRRVRLGMGPCQGGFCIYRATGILHAEHKLSAAAADRTLVSFLEERWKGVQPILYGDQWRQARLDDWIFQGVMNVDHLES